MILKQSSYEQNDYILFREIETVEEEVNLLRNHS